MTLVFQWQTGMSAFSQDSWDRLAQPHGFPFMRWSWLNLLEESGCVGGRTGWVPLHLGVSRDEKLVAVAPMYIKMHSRGEFVFDHQIAEVSERLGMPYYPKLLGMSPFTPATGYRFLIDPTEDERNITRLMLEEIDHLCAENNISGCHFLRVESTWGKLMVDLGMSPWLHHALVWENKDYASFDDYLGELRSKRRKSIRRERRKVNELALNIEVVRGDQAPTAWFGKMFDFYAATCRKFFNWSRYLNREFFEGLKQTASENIVFVSAFEKTGAPSPSAMTLLVHGRDHLYGRYWGSDDHVDHLHFEACYYQPMEWAIQQGIPSFDAGSGNAGHKRQRGFLARPVHSLHRFYEPAMAEIWADNVTYINEQEQEVIDHINCSSRSA